MEPKQHSVSERQTAQSTSDGAVDNLLERKQPAVARNDREQGGKAPDSEQDKTAKRKKESTPLSPLAEYLRELAKKFPKMDEEGNFYVTSGTGKQSVKNRKILSGTDLTDYLNEICQAGHVHVVSCPRDRALKAKGKSPWTEELKGEAQRCFQVPVGTRICLVWPDLFERDILESEESYRTKSGNIKTPCPYCLSNEFVSIKGFTTHERLPRASIHANATRTFIVGPWYFCRNPACRGKREKDDQDSGINGEVDRETSATVTTRTMRGSTETTITTDLDKTTTKKPPVKAQFTTYTGTCWTQFPQQVKRQYGDIVTRLDDGQCTFVSPDLCDLILDDRRTFADTANALKESYDLLETTALEAYYNFVDDEVEKNRREREQPSNNKKPEKGTMQSHFQVISTPKVQPTGKWPAFDFDTFSATFGRLPSQDTIRTIFLKAFHLVEPYLLRDLLTRLPGRIIRWDGTYSLMKKTMDDPDCGGKNLVAIIVFGEYGHIVSFAFSDSEANENVQKLIYFLRERMLRLGGQAAVDAVIGAYTDVCCEGNEDLQNHWFVKMFPNSKSPRKDLYHALKLVTEETAGPDHPLHEVFCRGLTGTILKWDNNSLEEALDLFMKDEEGGKGVKVRAIARDQMLQTPAYRDGIANYVETDRARADADVLRLYKEIEDRDKDMKMQASLESKGYVSYLKPPIRGVQRGTEACADNFRVHLRKGCYEDPLPCDEMNPPAKRKRPPNRKVAERPRKKMRLRGTNGCELTNKHYNRTGEHATRQCGIISYAKSLLFIKRHNHSRDIEVEHLTGVKPMSLRWFIREALQYRMEGHMVDGAFDGESYPPKFDPEKHMEPVGMKFQPFREWERVENEIARLLRSNNFVVVNDEDEVLPMQHDDIQADDGAASPASAAASLAAASPAAASPAAASPAAASPAAASPAAASPAAASPAVASPPAASPAAPSPAAASLTVASPAASSPSHGAELWRGNKLGAKSKLTLQSYVVTKLSPYQRETLLTCLSTVVNIHGNTLTEGVLVEKLVNIWNSWHVDKLKKDHYGHGGYLKEDVVKKFLKDEGHKLLQGDMGGRSIPHIVVPNSLPSAVASFPPPLPPPIAVASFPPPATAMASFPPPPTPTMSSFPSMPQHNQGRFVSYEQQPHYAAASVPGLPPFLDNSSYRQAGEELRRLGAPIPNDRTERIKRLKGYYINLPPDKK